jgi:hypothetical protein
MTEINRLEFDLRKIKAVKNTEGLIKLHQLIGQERFTAAWEELQKDPVEAALVAIHYCNNWNEFLEMLDTYEVSRALNVSLNRKFRDRVRENKNLSTLIATWDSQKDVA